MFFLPAPPQVDSARICDTLLQRQTHGSLLDVRQYGRSTGNEAAEHRTQSGGEGSGRGPLLLLGLHLDWAAVAKGQPAERRTPVCNMALALSQALVRDPGPQ